ncbi:hypothetical protein [Shimia sp. SDUM112013]|uniref:hypothetical protein n=1 Tax=Shimia sp. SDUM112013 TaxID=3136160 RepID=UPI0032EC5DA1
MKIKEKPQWPFGKPLGHIRIAGAELIDMLEKYEMQGVSVQAETSKHDFDSVTDMKSNLPLLRGDTKVTLKPNGKWQYSLSVNFSYCTTMQSLFYDSEHKDELAVLRQNIEAELKNHRTPFLWPFTIVPRFLWWGAVLGLWVGELIVTRSTESELSWEAGKFDTFVYSAFFLSCILGFLPPVYHSRKDTFWQRNKDKVLVGALMLVIGVLVTKYSPLLFGIFEK